MSYPAASDSMTSTGTWKSRGKLKAESWLSSSAAPPCVSSVSLEAALAAASENQSVFWEAQHLCSFFPNFYSLHALTPILHLVLICAVICLTVIIDTCLRQAMLYDSGTSLLYGCVLSLWPRYLPSLLPAAHDSYHNSNWVSCIKPWCDLSSQTIGLIPAEPVLDILAK